MTFGLYEVVGHREYRGHKPGTTFHARLDRHAEQRAIQRRDIRFLKTVQPDLQPGSFTFPDGWLPSQTNPTTRGAERRLTR